MIEQGIKQQSFKNSSENRKDADRSTIFNQVFRVSFVDCTLFFSSHRETHIPLTLIEISVLKRLLLFYS